MPIGLILGGVGALAGVAGSVISSNASKKAATTAATTAQNNTNANNALTREIFNENKGALAPYQWRGNVAGNAFNELLGLPGYGAVAPQPQMGPPTYGALQAYGGSPMAQNGFYPGDYNMPLGRGYETMGGEQVTRWDLPPEGHAGQVAPPAGALNVPGPPQGQPTARSAFQTYLDSTGYQHRFGEGIRALNMGAGANGMIGSGAADKARIRYGQDYGSNEFARYLGYLGNQQGLGLSGASALAGVGQNFAGTISANNTSAAEAAANAALMRANSTNQMWNGIAGTVGNFAGSALGGGWWK